MASRTNNFEGQSPGTTLTTGNSGGTSGDAFDQVSLGSGGTAVFTDTAAAFGAQSVRGTAAGAGTAIIIWQGYSVTSMAFRYYFRLPSLPTGGDVQLIQFRNSTGNAGFVQVSTAGQLKFGNTANSLTNVTGGIVSANTWYWLDTALSVSATAGVAKITLHAFDGSDTVIGTPFSITNANTGTTNLTNVRFLKPNSSNALDIFVDQAQVTDSTTTLIGPYVPPATPPNAAGVGATYYVFNAKDYSSAGSGGSITYSIAQDSGSTYTALEPLDGLFMVERASDQARIYTVTVTESPSTLTDTVQFTAPALIPLVGSNEVIWDGAGWA